ncbi:protein RALF-like 27 [Nicotiana tomentosiformis]|uniref:protein RALF-like 27 n=1 Tax=Nicotiana tomentosiformis TaxID=4098 RepID=UPI00051B2BCD|nr:protein RALF-like 27 [Nicotiana tomentosiformis]
MARETFNGQFPNLSTALLLLLTILLLNTINMPKVECGVSSQECNGISIGDCVVDGDEFLVESETSTLLLANGKGTLTYRSLQKPAICNAKIIGNCIGAQLNGPHRPCNYDNRCKHMP